MRCTSLILFTLLCLPLLGSCSSGPKEMTTAQKLDYYAESCMNYYDMHAFDRAIHQANKGLEVDPNNEFFRLVKARCLLLLDETETLEAAAEILDTMTGIENLQVHLVAGEVAERRGLIRWDTAKSIESGTTYTEAADPHARALELTLEAYGMWTNAIAHYKKANELFIGGTEGLNGIMRSATLRSSAGRALGLADEEIDLNDQLILDNGLELLQSLRESNKAKQRGIDNLRNSEENSWPMQRSIFANEEVMIATLIHLSELHRRLNRDHAALMSIDQALLINGELPRLHGRRAQLLLAAGDARRAKTSLEEFFRFTKLEFDHPDVVRARAAMRQCERLLESPSPALSPPKGD